MKMGQEHQAAELSGLESNAFGMQMNAKMYSIMIDKLYKHKEAAVIRELSCNARDSHVDAGCPDKPFDLHLPTWLDKTFYIRDYGTGIPPEKFEDIYTNLGASTKEDSNDFIGAYGLGSKTPFTMTDTFTIENFYDGRKHVYVCFKSEGFPQVSHLGSEDTKEPNGLKVSFAFDKGDVGAFTRATEEQLKFFKVKPTITGGKGSINWPKLPEFSTNGWAFLPDVAVSGYSTATYVEMGGVCYPYDLSDVPSVNSNGLRGKALVLKANLGDVDIPPSRETLEMTDKTKRWITERVSTVIRDYETVFRADIGKQVNYMDAHFFIKSNAGRLTSVDNKEKFTLANGETYTYEQLSGRDNTGVFQGIRYRGYRRHHANALDGYELLGRYGMNRHNVYYVNDLTRNISGVIRHNKDKIPTDQRTYIVTDSDWTVKEIEGKSKAAFDTMKRLGLTVHKLSSIIKLDPKTIKTYTKVPVKQVFTVNESIGSANTLKGALTEYIGDTPTEGYYLEIKGWEVVNHNCEGTDPLKQLCSLRQFGYTDKIYCIRTKSIDEVSKKLKPITELIDKAKKEIVASAQGYLNQQDVQKIFQEHTTLSPQGFIDLGWADPVYLGIQKELKAVGMDNPRNYAPGTYRNLAGTHLEGLKAAKPPALKNKLEVFDKKYRWIIKSINSGWRTEDMKKAMQQLKALAI